MNPLIVANWKMNPSSQQEAIELYKGVQEGVANIQEVDVVVCPPFGYLPQIAVVKETLAIGAQDSFWEEEGAYTGEASPQILKELGCTHVILGHSERRKYLGETFTITYTGRK